MSPATEARTVEIRLAHAVWGADRIGYQLTGDGTVPVPGRAMSSAGSWELATW
jgi:hypothetical protein